MKFYTKKRRNPVPVILPLIDILAILLIFFIVTTTFKKPVPQLQINLPESTAAVEAPAPKTEPLLLQVRSEEDILLDGEPVTVEALPERLRSAVLENPERALALQADREASFGLVVRILDALQEAGIKNIPAFTQPQSASNQPSETSPAP
jgi:biopolymer transport protein ExbD